MDVRNEVTGDVHGTVIQAGSVSVQLQVAHEPLATGLRAERRTAARISMTLPSRQHNCGPLTWPMR